MKQRKGNVKNYKVKRSKLKSFFPDGLAKNRKNINY